MRWLWRRKAFVPPDGDYGPKFGVVYIDGREYDAAQMLWMTRDQIADMRLARLPTPSLGMAMSLEAALLALRKERLDDAGTQPRLQA